MKYRYDYGFVAINMCLLMSIALLPFATSVLSRYSNLRSAIVFYALSMAFTGFVKTLLWHYAAKDFRLIDHTLSPQRIRRLTRRAMIPPLVFTISIGIVVFNPVIAKFSWAAIALTFL